MIKPEGERPSEELYVDGQELVKIMHSRTYKSAIWKLARHISTDTVAEIEAGFAVSCSVGMLPMVSHFSLTFARQYRADAVVQPHKVGEVPLVYLHFHPPQWGVAYGVNSYLPSDTDLKTLRGSREFIRERYGYDNFPLAIVAVASAHERIRKVLFQETPLTPEPTESVLSSYCCDAETVHSEKDILEMLRDYGYKAAIINYLPKKGLSTEDALVVQTFGPKLKYVKVTP